MIDFIRAKRRELTDTGEIERTLMVLAASGRPPNALGPDLEAELISRRRKDGSWSAQVNWTSFAVLALRAHGRPASDRLIHAAGRWIARQANEDGGFNFGRRGSPSGIDDTAAAIQGLVAAGRGATPTVRRAASFLARQQNPDGGFPLSVGGASNAQSTAFAVQAFVAARRPPARVRRGGSRDPLAYLRTLIGPDGAVRYSRTSRQTPVWVTAQALLAFAEQPFPLPPPAARRAGERGDRAARRRRAGSGRAPPEPALELEPRPAAGTQAGGERHLDPDRPARPPPRSPARPAAPRRRS